jgi:tetratricopeptide (TPR) repeat protein
MPAMRDEPTRSAERCSGCGDAGEPAARGRLRLWLIVPVAAALALRALYLYDYRGSPLYDVAVGPDVETYYEAAQRILAGQWLWTDAYHGPFYPYLLALWSLVTSDSLPAVRALQLLTGVLACVIVTLAVARRCGALAAGCTAALWALYVPVIYYEAELLAEGTALFLNAGVVALLLTPQRIGAPRAALAGLLLGLGAGVHASALLAALVVVGWLAATQRRESLRRGATVTLAAVIGVAVPAAGIVVYNSVSLGQFVFLQESGGLNFYIGANPAADGTPNMRLGPAWDGMVDRAFVEGELRQGDDYGGFFYRRALDFIRQSPGRWLVLSGKKAALGLSAREITASKPISAVRADIRLLQGPDVAFGILLVPALIGLMCTQRTRVAPAWLLVIAYVLSQTVHVAAGRYRVPMLPGMFVLGGVGLAHVIEVLRARASPALARVGVFAAAGIALAFLPIVPPREDDAAEAAVMRARAYRVQRDAAAAQAELRGALAERPEHGLARFTLGELLEEGGRPTEAIEQYRAAVAAHPDYRLARIRLAEALLKNRGDLEAARPHYVRAVELNPEDLQARLLLARALLIWDEWAAAADHFRFLLERGPNPTASFGLGQALARLGRRAEALPHLRAVLPTMPNNVRLLTVLARLHAASPEESIRDKELALQYAYRAAGLTGRADAGAMDALAMALANAGRFPRAAEAALTAARISNVRGQTELRDEILARRKLYLDRQPYRDAGPR